MEDAMQQKLQHERQEEQRRLDREAVQREKERVKKEIEEMQLKMKLEKVENLKNTAVGRKAFADITNEVRAGGRRMQTRFRVVFWLDWQDLKNMDADIIFSKQLKQIEKEKRDREIKLKTQEKKVSGDQPTCCRA